LIPAGAVSLANALAGGYQRALFIWSNKMREIKFRAKRIGNGEWIIGQWIYGFSGNIFIRGYESIQGYQVDPETIGQFTGLLDKNGREIYEGDIVREIGQDCSNCPPERVCNSPECPTIWKMRDVVTLDRFRHWLKNESFGYEGEDLISPDDCEIIGNIHENPELLNS
jgi:uncharacterized phage protein (TIGR01671 family)